MSERKNKLKCYKVWRMFGQTKESLKLGDYAYGLDA